MYKVLHGSEIDHTIMGKEYAIMAVGVHPLPNGSVKPYPFRV
jgi:hypothetical protein